uniref:Uncharacterized protein n=1 Tax=Panagrolaimus sp. JU765 TaxID=591449 RepID=A0AC34Q316_9BILA
MQAYRIIQLSIANANDSWIYTWLTVTSSILLLLNKPGCPYWRLASAVVIVLGFIETIFLAWTIQKVETGPLLDHSNSLPEGKSILLTALSVAATTSTRLRKPNHTGITSYIRTMILLVALIGLIPVFGYSACFYSQGLPICHLFH